MVGFWSVLTVKYLPRSARRIGAKEPEIFRRALEVVGADSRKWGFLWYAAMACSIIGLVMYWIRFAVP